MFIIGLLLCLFASNSPIENWQRIETEQRISFLFPRPAEELTRKTEGMESFIYQTKDDVCVFGVVCTDFSTSAIPLTNEYALQVYEQFRIGSVAMETAILKDEKTIPYDNMLIKEIEYSVIRESFEVTYFKRFIFRDNFVYQISIGGRSRHRALIMEEKDVFFNSLLFKE